MATLKTVQELLDSIDTGGGRGTTGEELQDLVESLASVYGHMALSNPGTTHTCNNSWQTFAEWTTSRDTRGVSENLTTGEYTLQAGGGGQWEAIIHLEFSVDTTGTYRLRPRGELADTTQVAMGADSARVQALMAGDTVIWTIIGLNIAPDILDTGGKLYTQIRGPNNAVVTPIQGWFRVKRV